MTVINQLFLNFLRVIYILKLNTESDKGIVISKISGSEISSHSNYEVEKL